MFTSFVYNFYSEIFCTIFNWNFCSQLYFCPSLFFTLLGTKQATELPLHNRIQTSDLDSWTWDWYSSALACFIFFKIQLILKLQYCIMEDRWHKSMMSGIIHPLGGFYVYPISIGNMLEFITGNYKLLYWMQKVLKLHHF